MASSSTPAVVDSSVGMLDCGSESVPNSTLRTRLNVSWSSSAISRTSLS